MTAGVYDSANVVREPMELLRDMLEEQFITHTNRLTELTVYGRLPGHGGYDPDALQALAATAREGIADTAQALRRMSEGTYGGCEGCHNDIPLDRLRALPHVRYCVSCQRRQPR
ncbi:TraR/DksA family transcriptional regulator [Micromonospora sp. NPDC050200]|uniref:TraR/DksA family transcriptional regulator n=1 Tax=Micromonospora sp. NPDC050200 TaxID=3155664 RepID=UPI0033C9F74D